MNNAKQNRDGAASSGRSTIGQRESRSDAQRRRDADQSAADDDQTLSDDDQTLSDDDQTASAADQESAAKDQNASDRDQATADRNRAADTHRTPAKDQAYDTSRDERETSTIQRFETGLARAHTVRERDVSALDRDRLAEARDRAGRDRDARAAALGRAAVAPGGSLEGLLEAVRVQAAADRARAAADRERAAMDRANAARERSRLEEELRSAHLDELTGAYRREMGRLALSHEIDRARRSDGRFVMAFVDVDGLKIVNDRDGHAAGDHVLQTVVREIRARLRSFDPIIRYGGDEFVCGLGGTDIEEAQRRFDEIGVALATDDKISISFGLASLGPDETPDQLTERADEAMLQIRAAKHRRSA